MIQLVETSEVIEIPRFARVDDYGGAWCIEPVFAPSLWHLANNPSEIVHHVAEMAEKYPDGMKVSDMKCVVEVTSEYGVGIADILISGPMMKHQPSGGGTSTIMARREISNAVKNKEVSGILLTIDSGGGTVDGMAELGAAIKAAGKQKPTWAFIQDKGASAAYWAAAQTSKIYANTPHAWVGSIGTLLAVQDASALAEKKGIKTLLFRTGPLKGMGTPGTAITDEHSKHLQALVEGVQESFDAAVKSGRGLSNTELADVKHGGVMLARDAVAAKLIDGVAPKEKVLAEFARHLKSQRTFSQNVKLEDTEPIAAGVLPTRELMILPMIQGSKGT